MIPGLYDKLLQALALILFLAGLLWSSHHSGATAEALRQEKAAAVATAADLKKTLQEYESGVAETARIAARARALEEHRNTTTKVILREIRVRIPVDAPALPGAWRVLHDAAAEGIPPPPAASSAGADGTPTSPQEAADTVAENYGTYHSIAGRLTALQEYVTKECK